MSISKRNTVIQLFASLLVGIVLILSANLIWQESWSFAILSSMVLLSLFIIAFRIVSLLHEENSRLRSRLELSKSELECLRTGQHATDPNASPDTFESVNLALLVADVIDEHIIPAENQGISLTCHADAASIVEGNSALFTTVLRHLIANSIYHSSGSEIGVELTPEGHNKVRLSVWDNGRGVPTSELPKIFERFYKVYYPGAYTGGSGLGLALVKRIVEIHNGEIAATNRPTGGLEITILLPVTQVKKNR